MLIKVLQCQKTYKTSSHTEDTATNKHVQ